jgi:hypothetical protein
MLRNDYLMRMIDEITQALLRATRLLQEKRRDEAQEELRAAYATLGLDPHLLDLLDPPSVLRMLSDHQQGAALELFLGDAQLALSDGRTDIARRRLALAQAVWTQGEREGAGWMGERNTRERIAALEGALREASPRVS